MDESVLSEKDIENCRDYVSSIENHLSTYDEELNELKRVLTKEDIIKTFFDSGYLGQNVNDNLNKLYNLITSFRSNVDNLNATTNNFLNEQESTLKGN